MDWSQTKVVVVDDQKDDVENLLALLNKKGTPYNYYYEGASPHKLPASPLKNVRLLFLDFVLGTDGQPEKTKISALINILRNVLSKDNGPYILFAWTLHNDSERNTDLLPAFKRALFAETDLPKPFAIIDLDKIKNKGSLEDIEKKLEQELGGSNVFELLLKWETSGSLAMADTLKDLIDLSMTEIPASATNLDDYSRKLQGIVEKHMYQFARSLTGGNVRTGSEMLIDSQLSLNGVLQDHFERRVRGADYKFTKLIQKIKAKSSQTYNYKERARMNSYFLITSRANDSRIQPGNVYARSTIVVPSLAAGTVAVRKAVLFEKRKYRDRATKPADLAKFQELNRRMVPILFEITPQCDYVQGKWKTAKFVGGFLYPHKFLDGTDTSAYFKQKVDRHFQILVEYKGEPYQLVLHADYQTIIPLTRIPAGAALLFCARKELLGDVQHWCAKHGSRPGKTEF